MVPAAARSFTLLILRSSLRTRSTPIHDMKIESGTCGSMCADVRRSSTRRGASVDDDDDDASGIIIIIIIIIIISD